MTMQTDWAVDSTTGNDNNPGSPASPFKMLSALSRAWYGNSFAPISPVVTVALHGSFSTEQLALAANFPGATTVHVIGDTSVTDGPMAITSYTAEAPPTRASLSSTGFDFGARLRHRVRVTTGPQTGAVSWIMSASALGVANVSQFELLTATGVSTVNPSVGDQFVIETLSTQIQEYNLLLHGGANIVLRDCKIGSSVSGFVPRNYANVAEAPTRVRVFGCEFVGAPSATQLVQGYKTLGGCAATVPFFSIANGSFTVQGLAQFGFVQTSAKSFVIANRWCADGNGVNHVGLVIGNGSYVEDIAPRSVFGCVNGTIQELVRIEDCSQWVESSGAAVFYGSLGNTTTNALRVRNGCGMGFVVTPTATGLNPGQDVVLASNPAIPWADVPKIASKPDNAFVNVR